MLKIKDNVDRNTLNGFKKHSDYRGIDTGELIYWHNGTRRITIDKNGYIQLNNITYTIIEDVLFQMIKDGIIEKTNEKKLKKYAYMTKVELENRIKELEEENKKLKDKVGDIE